MHKLTKAELAGLAPPLLPCPRPPRQSCHSIAPALPLPAAHQILISQVTPGVSCLAPGLSVDMHSPPPPRPPSLHLSLANFLPAILYPQHVSLSGPQASSLPPPASQPAGGLHCPTHLLTTLGGVASVLRSQASNYTKFIKIHQTDVAKDPWQAAGSRRSGEEEPWRLKEGGSAGVRLWDCVSEGNRDLSGTPNKAGRPTGWKNKRLPKWICFQREFGNKKVAFKYLLCQL